MALGDEVYSIAEKAIARNKVSGEVLQKVILKIDEKASWGKEQLKQEILKIILEVL